MAKKRKPSKKRKVMCSICNKIFETNHSQGKYCSEDCRKKGHKGHWRKYGRKNKEKRKNYHKKYYEQNKEKIKTRIEIYRRTPAGKQAQKKSDENQRKKNPEKYFARQEVLKALRKGILKRLPCKFCGNKKSVAHHSDYSKPLKVTWACDACHARIHKKVS